MKRKNKLFLKIIASLLCIILVLPINTKAIQPEAVAPCASAYIDGYNGYISPKGDGSIKIVFSITGPRILDDLGITSITLYESEGNYDWFAVKTYYSSSYSNLMGSNVSYHGSSVTYQGTPGCYYEAHICFSASDETGGDTRQIYTTIVRAT